jgi:hypothetical protein
MLSGEALDLAFALRAKVDGPTVGQLRQAIHLPEAEFATALAELEGVGFVAIDRISSTEPVILVLAPLQIYLDDLENQGSDDL